MKEDRSLGYFLGRTLRIFLNEATIEFKNKNIDLTFEQYLMLKIIDSDASIIQQDIARQLKKDKSIVVRQLDNLMEKEYVVRVSNSSDKRKKNLVLTSDGKEIMNRISQLNFKISHKLIEGVSETDYNSFLFVLDKICENAGPDDDLFR